MVKIRYSGGGTNLSASTSIGGGMSNQVIPVLESDGAALMENLFYDTTRIEIINNSVSYRCFYIFNDESLNYVKLLFKNITIPDNCLIEFAVEQNYPAQTIVNEFTSPTNLLFYNFVDWDNLIIPFGNLNTHKDRIAIWIKRQIFDSNVEPSKITIDLDGTIYNLGLTGDFISIKNHFENSFVAGVSPNFLTNESYVGEALTS